MNKLFYILISLLCLSQPTWAKDKNIEFDITVGTFSYLKKWDVEGEGNGGYEVGGVSLKGAVGVYNQVNESHSVGTSFDYYQNIEGAPLWSVKVIDYRYKLLRNWQLSSFFGAARINTGTPAHGYIIGAGLIYQFPKFDNQFIQVEMKFFDKLTRDINGPDEMPRYGDIGLYLAGINISWGRRF